MHSPPESRDRRHRRLRAQVALAAGVLAALVGLAALTLPASGSFPGLNGKIAFTSYRGGPGTRDLNDDIYVMNADGSAQTRLTHNPASEYEPAFSPDGQRIAFD
ncbi:MAG: hypothetical protein ABIZ50_06840, partial [Solirubrobacterales bacterium]